jgi:excinuclease ABC subunit C
LRPRYNIVLRDDKSYPWLVLTEDHPYPQITKHRGERRKGASYWGPFASTWAVNQTLTGLAAGVPAALLPRHGVRQPRPALPAVPDPALLRPLRGAHRKEDYADLVRQAKQFLSGETPSIQKNLAREMEEAAERLEFERAAALRDRIRGLTHVQGRDRINMEGIGDADVVALHQLAGRPACRCSSSAAAATTATGPSS